MWALPAAAGFHGQQTFSVFSQASIGAFICIFVNLLEKRMKDVCSYSGLYVQVRSHLGKKVEFLV